MLELIEYLKSISHVNALFKSIDLHSIKLDYDKYNSSYALGTEYLPIIVREIYCDLFTEKIIVIFNDIVYELSLVYSDFYSLILSKHSGAKYYRIHLKPI